MNIDHPADLPWSIEVVSSVVSDKTPILANFAAKATLKGLVTHTKGTTNADEEAYCIDGYDCRLVACRMGLREP